MRAGSAVACRRSAARSPGSRPRSVRTCQGLRPRRVVQGLALTPPSMLPSAYATASAPGTVALYRGRYHDRGQERKKPATQFLSVLIAGYDGVGTRGGGQAP